MTDSHAARRVVTVVGARPQFIKAAAVSRALTLHNVEEILVHTGQHYDEGMSGSFFTELGLAEPAYNLGVGSGPHGQQTGRMLERLEPVLAERAPDAVVVYGDTNSTLAGALAAAKLCLPTAHVEAGLRCGRRDMAEEINRLVTDRLATLLFCPSAQAVANLAAEGITEGVHLVGDVMFDVLRWALAADAGDSSASPLGPYALATVHRAENTDNPARLGAILAAFSRLAAEGLPVVVPLHPRTRLALDGRPAPAGVTFTDPVSHAALVRLAAGARVVLTDSGGLQKEAYWLGVPCVTLCDETEWVETVDTGWNTLAGCDEARIAAAAAAPAPASPGAAVYGDGTAADAVVRTLVSFLDGR